jgi:hypothetical protein
MAPRRILEFSPDDDFSMFGISCHLKDYRFCWLLNRQLEIQMRRVGDYYPKFDKKQQSQYAFPFYFGTENFRLESFFLLGNHSPEGDLMERYTQIDYVFLIHEMAYPSGPSGMVQEIRKIPQVLMAFEINPKDYRDSELLFSGIELCLMEFEKEQRQLNSFETILE